MSIKLDLDQPALIQIRILFTSIAIKLDIDKFNSVSKIKTICAITIIHQFPIILRQCCLIRPARSEYCNLNNEFALNEKNRTIPKATLIKINVGRYRLHKN